MNKLTHNSFLCMFISIPYVFRAFKCSSSGDSIVSIRYLVSLYVGDRLVCRVGRSVQTCIPDDQSDIHQMLY